MNYFKVIRNQRPVVREQVVPRRSCVVIGAMLREANRGTRVRPAGTVFREKISNAKGKSVKDAEPDVQS
jgi:hypothetical protein